jgi:hypothetical protein
MEANNHPLTYAHVRSVGQDQRALRQEADMKKEPLPLPVAMQNEEITEQDFDILLRIAKDPSAPKGRLKINPRRIPLREREAVNS